MGETNPFTIRGPKGRRSRYRDPLDRYWWGIDPPTGAHLDTYTRVEHRSYCYAGTVEAVCPGGWRVVRWDDTRLGIGTREYTHISKLQKEA